MNENLKTRQFGRLVLFWCWAQKKDPYWWWTTDASGQKCGELFALYQVHRPDSLPVLRFVCWRFCGAVAWDKAQSECEK